jgi:hypothetical protein
MKKGEFNEQVFINCPFDANYTKIFRAIVFTILDCGLVPRCSLEVSDATQFRLRAIIDLIKQCKYAIHDLSRVELDTEFNLPRFNMPFETGIFYGARFFGQKRQRTKNCIILEKEKYRYQKFISDLSGIDINHHNNQIRQVVSEIRNWLATSSNKRLPEPQRILSRYRKFTSALRNACRKTHIDINSLPFIDLTRNMTDWLKINQIEPHRLFF